MPKPSPILYTLKDLRDALKTAGYRLRTKRNSSFIETTVLDASGEKISFNPIFSSEKDRLDWLAKHQKLIDIRDKFASHTADDLFRVIL